MGTRLTEARLPVQRYLLWIPGIGLVPEIGISGPGKHVEVAVGLLEQYLDGGSVGGLEQEVVVADDEMDVWTRSRHRFSPPGGSIYESGYLRGFLIGLDIEIALPLVVAGIAFRKLWGGMYG